MLVGKTKNRSGRTPMFKERYAKQQAEEAKRKQEEERRERAQEQEKRELVELMNKGASFAQTEALCRELCAGFGQPMSYWVVPRQEEVDNDDEDVLNI